MTMVKCPERPHECRISRLFCLLMPYDWCMRCDNRNFQVVFPQLQNSIRCPVTELALQASTSPVIYELRSTHPTLAKDVSVALTGDLAGMKVERQICRVTRPFYTCISCRGREGYDPLKR